MSEPWRKNDVIDQGKYRKQPRQRKCTEYKYRFQYSKYVSQTAVKMSYVTTKFPALKLCGTHIKFHGVRDLRKHYLIWLDPTLVHKTFKLQRILCVCVVCTNITDNPWAPVVSNEQQPRYQPVFECTNWSVLGSSGNCNIIQFENKTKLRGTLRIFIRLSLME